MSEHTPSPRSVVVVPLEDWKHVIGALKNAKARLPMGAAIGNVSDALSKVEHLQAAPAPSSLAGGEVIERAIDFIARYEDVNDSDYGVPEPNEAMQINHDLREFVRCKNKGGEVDQLSAGCLVPGCTSETGETCKGPKNA